MKPGSVWKLVKAPDHYLDLLGPVEEVKFSRQATNLDGIHLFSTSSTQVERGLLKYKDQIKPNGMIWVSWYKKSAKIPTDVNEDLIRGTALALGLVDVKVCAVDEKWSALKIVWRKENRK